MVGVLRGQVEAELAADGGFEAEGRGVLHALGAGGEFRRGLVGGLHPAVVYGNRHVLGQAPLGAQVGQVVGGVVVGLVGAVAEQFQRVAAAQVQAGTYFIEQVDAEGVAADHGALGGLLDQVDVVVVGSLHGHLRVYFQGAELEVLLGGRVGGRQDQGYGD